MKNLSFFISSGLLLVVLFFIIFVATQNFEIEQLQLELAKCQEAVKICVDIANKPWIVK